VEGRQGRGRKGLGIRRGKKGREGHEGVRRDGKGRSTVGSNEF